jgi:hypothetical protein
VNDLKESWRQEDKQEIEDLKNEIKYFNERVVVRELEGEKKIVDPLLEIISGMEICLKNLERKYENEHGNKTTNSLFE